MERRNFLKNAGMLTAFGGISPLAYSTEETAQLNDPLPLKPVLLPSLPVLEHNGGMQIRTWVRSAMTNGIYSNVECAVAPKLMGPPPHYHKELDELMHVVEGTASILIGDDIVEVEAGGWHLRPRMITHTFWNASNKPLRFIDMYFNQPFEEYLETIFNELTEKNGYVDGSEKKNMVIGKLNDKFGLIFPSNAFDKRTEIMKKYELK